MRYGPRANFNNLPWRACRETLPESARCRFSQMSNCRTKSIQNIKLCIYFLLESCSHIRRAVGRTHPAARPDASTKLAATSSTSEQNRRSNTRNNQCRYNRTQPILLFRFGNICQNANCRFGQREEGEAGTGAACGPPAATAAASGSASVNLEPRLGTEVLPVAFAFACC